MSTIPNGLNPVYLEHLKAKSAKNGGDTLAQHTWDVLTKLGDQFRLRNSHTAHFGDVRIWQRLYIGCFLHDFGKAAQGFQERLLDKPIENQWKDGQHRHEVLSLAAIDWVCPPGHPDRLAVIGVIVSHHKDAAAIFSKYGGAKPDSDQIQRVEYLAGQIPPADVDALWQWLNEFGTAWQAAVGFNGLEAIQPVNRERFGADTIRNALAEFRRYLLVCEDGELEAEMLYQNLLQRGMIVTADHAASAGAPPFPDMALSLEIAAKPLVGKSLRPHQQRMTTLSTYGSSLLIAPTGSGKTEAALLWAAQQMRLQPASRLFYTLPYQASMNAMETRLKARFFGRELGDAQVSVQHSRATLRFYQEMMDADDGTHPRLATAKARERKNYADLNLYPVRVFSPYQMLKAAFSLKAYETLLLDYAHALFIFDEIHAYDVKRLAQIVTFMGWLRKHFGARFLIMTATLPPILRGALQLALAIPDAAVIEADAVTFADSQRHTVHLIEDDLLNQVGAICERYQHGEAVLVVCNQVKRAQTLYNTLKQHIPTDDLLMLHGRFNGADRKAKETALAQRVGVGAAARRPLVMVATQVVEVSLDVDFDVLFTDPAPLEALLQRFGRVNRGRAARELRPVWVHTQPTDDKDLLPYDAELVRRGLDVLQRHCVERPIDESIVSSMLGEVYADTVAARWQADYVQHAQQFQRQLDAIQPYQSADEHLRHSFYDMFDGYQILPIDLENAYRDTVESAGYLAASGYLVNISSGQYHQLRTKGLVAERGEKDFFDVVHVPYSTEYGLDIAGGIAAKANEQYEDEEV